MARNQRQAAAYYLRGVEAIKIENFGIARTMLTRALELDKDNTDIMFKLGQVLLASGFMHEGLAVLQRCVKRRPNHPDSLLLLSQAHMGLAQIDEMHAALDKALDWDPTHGACLHAKVTAFINTGELELARQVMDRAAAVDDPHPLILLARAKLARASKEYGRGIDAINALLDHPGAMEHHKRSARFELGHIHDKLGEYDKAFEVFSRANAGHIPGKILHAESMISMWTPELLASIPRSSIETDRPVFIMGMPRSGTTLTEQILAAHPRAAGIGECPLIAQQLVRRSPSALTGDDIDSYTREYIDMLGASVEPGIRRVADKHMGGERTLGLISRMLPGAKVIHCLRDPIDSCLSAYFQNFGTNVSYSRDLAQLGKHYVAHQRVMEHWYAVLDMDILQSSYESLIADPQAGARALVAHLDLEFDERCLRFHESREHVGTASSTQVRSPIYQSSRERWKNYEKHLGPLLGELGDSARLDPPGGTHRTTTRTQPFPPIEHGV